jgi:hypothetical protein
MFTRVPTTVILGGLLPLLVCSAASDRPAPSPPSAPSQRTRSVALAPTPAYIHTGPTDLSAVAEARRLAHLRQLLRSIRVTRPRPWRAVNMLLPDITDLLSPTDGTLPLPPNDPLDLGAPADIRSPAPIPEPSTSLLVLAATLLVSAPRPRR